MGKLRSWMVFALIFDMDLAPTELGRLIDKRR